MVDKAEGTMSKQPWGIKVGPFDVALRLNQPSIDVLRIRDI